MDWVELVLQFGYFAVVTGALVFAARGHRGAERAMATGQGEWLRAAEELGLEFAHGIRSTDQGGLVGTLDGFKVVAEHYFDGERDPPASVVRIRVELGDRAPEGVSIRREGRFGLNRDLQLGNAEFDTIFRIDGPPATLAAALPGDVRRGLVQQTEAFSTVAVEDGELLLEARGKRLAGGAEVALHLRAAVAIATELVGRGSTEARLVAGLDDRTVPYQRVCSRLLAEGWGGTPEAHRAGELLAARPAPIDRVRASRLLADDGAAERLAAPIAFDERADPEVRAEALDSLAARPLRAVRMEDLSPLLDRKPALITRAALGCVGRVGALEDVAGLLGLAGRRGEVGAAAKLAIERIRARSGVDGGAGRLAVAPEDAAAGRLSRAVAGGALSVAKKG